MAAVDAISVVERCYDLHGDRASWLTRVTEAVQPLIDHGLGAQGVALRWPRDGALELLEGAFLGPEPTREFTYRTYDGLGPEGRDVFFRWTPILDIARETMRNNGVDIAAWESQSPDGYRFRDLIILCARDGTDEGVGLSAYSERPIHVPAQSRRMLRKLAWHIAAGWRLLQPARMAAAREAVLAPDGKCLHAEPDAQGADVQEALRDAARAIDRARGPLRRTDPEGALALWRGLVLGRWSLVDRFESDGRRYVIACRNDVGCDDPRGLTARERQCAHLAASGYGNAEIAYALSLKESTVGSHVHRAVRKLGLRRRTDLATALAPIPQDARVISLDPGDGSVVAASVPISHDTPHFAALTPGERGVVEALLRGSTLKEIGRSRGTSARTVANQAQSIYRKLGVQSRAQLVALLSAGSKGQGGGRLGGFASEAPAPAHATAHGRTPAPRPSEAQAVRQHRGDEGRQR